MAKSLIAALTTDWEPTKYQDQYQTALMEMIERKVQHRTQDEPVAKPRPASNVVDLVSVLQESLQKATKREKAPGVSKGRKTTSALVKQKRRSAA